MKTSTLFRAYIIADARMYVEAINGNINMFERYSRLVTRLYRRILARLEARND